MGRGQLPIEASEILYGAGVLTRRDRTGDNDSATYFVLPDTGFVDLPLTGDLIAYYRLQAEEHRGSALKREFERIALAVEAMRSTGRSRWTAFIQTVAGARAVLYEGVKREAITDRDGEVFLNENAFGFPFYRPIPIAAKLTNLERVPASEIELINP